MAVSRISQQSIQQAFPKGNTVWDGTSTVPSMDSLGTVVVGSGGLSTITFSSIPATYTHLQLRGFNLSGTASSGIIVRFNSDSTTTNYFLAGIDAPGTGSATGFTSNNTGYVFSGYTGDATNPAPFVMDILNYSNTSVKKQTRAISGNQSNGARSEYVTLLSGTWVKSTLEAINTITITHGSAIVFNQYSQFSLYGVK
jgi:hypothetical protein